MKGMEELRSTRCYHVIHLRLAAKLEMQLTISAFCFSAPHMLWRKGGREDKTRGSYKPLPHPQVSSAQPDWSHKDFALMARRLLHTCARQGFLNTKIIWKHFWKCQIFTNGSSQLPVVCQQRVDKIMWTPHWQGLNLRSNCITKLQIKVAHISNCRNVSAIRVFKAT